MTDIVVSFVLENLKMLLMNEANLFLGVKDDVNLLQDDLSIMNAFLKDSEGKQNDHYLVEELINQIRDTVYEAEDVTNTYMAHLIKQQRRKLLVKLLHCCNHAFVLRHIADNTKIVKSKIENIYANKSKFGIEAQPHVDEEAQQLIQKRRRNVEEEDVVGFGDDTRKLVNQLIDERRLQREVISIIGMGGLGKTTLARKIYNNAHIKNHFHCCAWVNVSQEYTTTLLLLDILKRLVQISDVTYKMSDEELKVTLHDNLKGKRYFIVMDDVWEPRFWDEIKACFPEDLNGSRILITSREKEVASHASSTPPYFLPFLDKDTSWELLCKKVFRGEKCPSNLEDLGRTLAESCKGLPLSIVVLGGILANKEKSHRIWSDFIGKVNWFLMEDKKRCSDILALSYNHLPRKLRLCFLYVGVFPEDYVIPATTLTQLWVAEGLISIQNDRRMMNDFDIAEYYLEELIDRSLIQVASRRSDGGVKTCRIHDLLRDMCIKMSIHEKFYEVHVNIADLRSSNSNPRRLSMQGNINSQSISSSSTGKSFSVRSLLLFTSFFHEDDWKWVVRPFRFIRLLSIEVADVGNSSFSIPKEIGKLIFLRYLKISPMSTNRLYFIVQSIPTSICKLPFLETIHLVGSIRMRIPNHLWMMKQLRHLYVNGGMELSKPWTISKVDQYILSSLQILAGLVVDNKTALLIRESLFPYLRKLNLIHRPETKVDDSEILEILASLESLHYLQTLKLEDVKLGQGLDYLYPSKLTKITFVSCKSLDSNDMKILGKLANLRILKIRACDMKWSRLYIMAGGFPQLEVFKMIDLNIETWELEEHAMWNLQHLAIEGCENLRNLPDELWSMANLRMVKVLEIQTDLKEKLMKELKMKDGCKLIIN